MELIKEFEFKDIVYHEARYSCDVSLSGTGKYTVTAGEDTDSRFIEAAFSETLERAFKHYGDFGVPYFIIAYEPETLTTLMNAMLQEKWPDAGISLKSVSLKALYPDEPSVKLMIEAKKSQPNT